MIRKSEILALAIFGVTQKLNMAKRSLEKNPNSFYFKGEAQKLNKQYTELRQMLSENTKEAKK